MSNELPPAEPPGGRRKWILWVGIVALFLGTVGGGLYWWKTRPAGWEEVYSQNNRAIAVMDGYHYDEAVPEFEKVVEMAPDWLPGRINLGIALLNASGEASAERRGQYAARCKATFEEVLRRDADEPHAHFCLGILLMYEKDGEEARKHFEAVLRTDPDDAYAWYWLGSLMTAGSDEQTECYQKAVRRDNHLRGALYGLSQNLRQKDPAAAQKMLDDWQALVQAGWLNVNDVKYSQMGPLAEVIGRPADRPTSPPAGPLPPFRRNEQLRVQLAPGARWAKAADLGDDAAGELRRLVRRRFGATMVVLDYNGDDKPDLFLAGAVVENGRVRDLLLRNDGGGSFTDVTTEARLDRARAATLGCCVGDFDNDERPDLLLTGAGALTLFRNKGDGTFKDVTAAATSGGTATGTLDRLRSVCLAAAWVDLDQDADLDLLLGEFAPTVEDAVRRLQGEKVKPSGTVVTYLNQGAPPLMDKPSMKSPPLEPKFRRTTLPDWQAPAAALTGLALSDMDGDRDVDVLLLADGTSPSVAVNDRLLHFRRAELPAALAPAAGWNGALVLDANHEGRSDLLLLPDGERPRLLVSRARSADGTPGDWFEAGAVDGPPLRQAVAVDVNLDSWTDVVGLSRDGRPVLLRNEGGKLAAQADAFARDADWPGDLVAVAVADADGDFNPDLFVWSEGEGLQLYESRGNGGNGVLVRLVGRRARDRHEHTRCNYDAVGAWAVAQAGRLWAGQENTTLGAGLGQSRPPLLFGIARHPRVEVLRLRWPDGTLQAEADTLDREQEPPDLRAGRLARVLQRNRMPGSCPVLFAWDGRRFGFVCDFLGAASLGETGPDGTCRPPRPEESIAIEPDQLVPRDGQYVLKITEPMDETTYLDSLQLVVADHPPGVRVYPDERFVTAGPPPSQQLIAFRQEIFPVTARDHRGRDVTGPLRLRDRVTVDDFAHCSWLGFAEEHAVELDFGDRLSRFGPNDRLYLCLAGWTQYPFPESSWAAGQAGIVEQWPVLERQDDSGRWHPLGEAGFPAGSPRMMLADVTGKLTGPRCRLRLRSNMQVYWDQAFIAADCRTVAPGESAAGSPRATCLEVHSADLAPGRVPREFSPDGRLPKVYDREHGEDMPLFRQSGWLTRFGDVSELLRPRDDRFVIFGPGDDLTVRFDAGSLPPLPAGWRRSFVLRTAGYCKDTALSTAHGATVGPLPFAAMRRYPYGADQEYPRDPPHLDYLRRYLTREVMADAWPAWRW